MIVRPSVVYVDPNADLQAAMNALSVTGGVVQLGPGTFDVAATLTYPDNVAVRLIGSGEEVTKLRFLGLPANSDCIKIRGGWSSLESMTVQGQTTSGTGKLVVIGSPTVRVGYVELSRLFLHSSAAETIYFEGSEAGHSQLVLGCRVVDCKVRTNYSAGSIASSMVHIGTNCTTNRFLRCAFDNWKGVCITDYSGSAGYGTAFDRCSFDNPADDVGDWIRFSNALHPKVLGCSFENTTAFHSNHKIRSMNGCTGLAIQDCNVITNQGWELCFAIGYGSVPGSIDAGARLSNNWLHTNTASSGTTNIVLGVAGTETVFGAVLEGGGVRETNNPNIMYPWDSFITGDIRIADNSVPDGVSYEDDYVMYNDAIVTY